MDRIAFPVSQKEYIHFTFFSSVIKNKPSKYRNQTQVPKEKKPSNPLSRQVGELRLLYLRGFVSAPITEAR